MKLLIQIGLFVVSGLMSGYVGVSLAEKGLPDSGRSGTLMKALETDFTGQNVYTWKDGDRVRRVRMQSNLHAKAVSNSTAIGEDEVMVKRGGMYILAKQDAGDDSGMPVFLSEGGQLMTLPGGVVLVFEPELSAAGINQFFIENAIDMSQVSAKDFTKNAFFVKTAAGMSSLALANRLADQDHVIISSPNWWQELIPK